MVLCDKNKTNSKVKSLQDGCTASDAIRLRNTTFDQSSCRETGIDGDEDGHMDIREKTI